MDTERTSNVVLSNSFPMTFANQGDTLTVTEIRACDKLRQHLNGLGLAVGAEVRVVQAASLGSIIVAVKQDTRLALGCSMAQKILVARGAA